MTLSSIPIPLRIAGCVVLALVLFYVASKFSGVIAIAAIVAWAVVLGGLLYATGLAPGIPGLPIVGKLVLAISLPQSQPMSRRRTLAGEQRSDPSTLDMDKLAADAQHRLGQLAGNHPAVSKILKSIVPLAETRALRQQRILGAPRALVAIVFGPRGVGKSTIADALADLLIAHKAVSRPVKVILEAPVPGRIEADWTQTLERGLDSIVLVDNARWLADSNTFTQTINGEALLASISSLADRYPGKLAIIISMTTDQYDKAFASQAATEYLRRMTFFDFPCDSIDQDSLYRLFVGYLRDQRIELDPKWEKKIIRSIREAAEYEGDRFDHAEAMRRWAEQLSMRLAEDNRQTPTDEDLSAVIDQDIS